MKEEIKGYEDKLERNEQVLATVQGENKKLSEPLKEARDQVADLQRQLGSQEKEKSALISAQSKLKSTKKKVSFYLCEWIDFRGEVYIRTTVKTNNSQNEQNWGCKNEHKGEKRT